MIKLLALIAMSFAGLTFTAQAQCSPPPLGNSTSDTGKISLSSAGTVWLVKSTGGDQVYMASGSSTLTTANGALFFDSYGPCTPVIPRILGFYVQPSAPDSRETVSSIPYGGTAGVTLFLAGWPNPKNLGADDSYCSINKCVGDPVNSGTGNFYLTEADFVGAPSTQIELKRYYNSQAVNASTLGLNWQSTYDRRVLTFAGSHLAQVYRADGRIDSFWQTGGVWVSDADVRSKLTSVMMGSTQVGWQVVTPDDTTENYNLGGQLTSIVTRAGLTTTLSYNTSNKLATVTGPFGHTLTYAYNANGNVATITAPNGGVYSYTYDTHNNLASVTYPDSSIRHYQYTNASFPNALTSIIDELGNTYATIAYDTKGRATSTQHAGGADLTTIAYNTNGTVTVTDPRGNTHTYTFTTQLGTVKPAALSGQPSPSVGGKAFTYDANGFISSTTDFNNNVTHYTRDSSGNETSRIEAFGTPLARTISTAWHSTFHLPLSITEPNRTTTFTYDSNGNLLSKTITSGSASRTWTYTYNASGQILTVTDPNGNTTTYTYDAQGNVATIANAAGHVTRFTSYDAAGRPLSITDPNGLVTTFTYDARGRLASRSSGGELTSYTYDVAGNLTKVTRPDSSYFNFTYDTAHRHTETSDSFGNSVAYTLDAAGNTTSRKIYDPASTLKLSRSFTYDSVERLQSEVGALGQTTTYAYDANSNLTGITDPLGHAFNYAYDALNRRASMVDPNGKTTSYGYDANDHLTSVTDPRSLATTYAYTGLNDLSGITSPDTGSAIKTYDASGNVATSTDANGNKTTYSYDSLNRVATAAYADGTSATWTYDQGVYGKGHLATLQDVTGTTAWTYDIHGRLTQKQQTTGLVVLTTAYTYDAYGRLSTVTYPSSQVISLAYDVAGRISSISSGGAAFISSITYQPFGQVSGWIVGNGAPYTRTIDQDGRISAISIGGTATVPGTTTLTYTLDNADRITGLTETGLPDKSFAYDSLDRLTSFVNGTSTTNYAYDNDGNRTSLTTAAGATTYTYPAGSNRLSSLSGANTASYSYDAAGSIISDGVNSWAYDTRERMLSNTVGSIVTTYGVNGLGQRIMKTGGNVPSGSNEFVYDSAGHLIGEYDNAGTAIEETVWLGDTPVAVLTGAGPSAPAYYINSDRLNAPHLITDSSGNPVWAWDHLAFGDAAPNQNPSGLGAFSYNLGFPGQYSDSESGANYNYYRDYAPALGRYIQSDPVGLRGGINTYAYVESNPIRLTDRKGQFLDPLTHGVIAGIVIIAVAAETILEPALEIWSLPRPIPSQKLDCPPRARATNDTGDRPEAPHLHVEEPVRSEGEIAP
jgi:RHS repeat-associated protein